MHGSQKFLTHGFKASLKCVEKHTCISKVQYWKMRPVNLTTVLNLTYINIDGNVEIHKIHTVTEDRKTQRSSQEQKQHTEVFTIYIK